jgi:ABC-type uncharacterized transport system permease subunit
VSERRIEQLRLLVLVLFAAAAAALVLSVVAAITIATSSSSIAGLDETVRQNRGVVALGALGGGIVGAGIMAGLAGILTVMLDREQERKS